MFTDIGLIGPLPSAPSCAIIVLPVLTSGIAMLKTKMSSKGQVILPKSIRDSRHWPAGTELVVEETADGVLLRRAKPFSPSRLEDLVGCLSVAGNARTIAEMDQAIDEEIRDRHDRGRY